MQKRGIDKMLTVLETLLAIVSIGILIWLLIIAISSATAQAETETETTREITETDYVYIICDVAGFSYDDKGTAIECVLPNGEVHTYYAQDTPLEMELVCLKTANQDDYATYEIVAIR